jgi:autotransporter-associated beta strand protein
MMPRLLSSCRWALPLVLLLVLLAILRMQPAAETDQAVSLDPPRLVVDTAPLDAFDAWLTDDRNVEAVAQGVELARARRVAMKELIRINPQAALERAVSYSARKQLPEPVVRMLEKPVSTTADLVVEQACGGPGGRSWRQHWLMLDGQRVQVFTYGERAEVMTKEKLSVHGIAIDEVMAMRDDPLRELPAEEVADRGLTGRVVQLGKRLLGVESDAALEAARQRLRESEETLGPEALPAYRELALGQLDGMFPLVMQDGGTNETEDDLPPVVFSPWTEGAKTMLYIRARFADEAPAYEPVTLANAQSNQAAAEAFWEDNSYGKSTLTTTYTTVVTLPKNGGDYVNDFNSLHLDARAAALAASSAWNHANFSFYTVITNTATNAQGNGFSYSGIAQLNGKASHLLRNFISVRTASHEYGHNLGLNHSEYWLTDSPSPIGEDSKPGGYVGDAADDERIEYGHRFAIMSGQSGAGDFDSGRAHYAASDKNRLDWLAAGDIVSTTTSGTIRLQRHDVRTADFGAMSQNVPRAIKINLPATDPTGFANPYKYWLNYRMLPTNGIAGSWLPHGLQVDWRRDGGGFRAVQLDMTPYSRDSGPYGLSPGPFADNNDKEDAVLLIGRTFSDTGADIHFTPVAKGGTNPNEWLDVVVNIGTQGNNAAPVISNFTVTNPNPATGQVINFNVTATDSDGDALAYHWDMGDNSVQAPQLNLPTRGKQWGTAGYYVVRVEVSDMKGGKTTASRVIRVGSPDNNGMIYGRVTHAGRPVEGALVRGGGVNTWTDSEGSYVLPGLPLGNATVTAAKAGLTFTPQFTNPVQATAFGAFGIDFAVNEPWTGGGTVVILSPHRIDLPLGFATRFSAQAFDNSGNPAAFNPTWSVTGGGTIDSNGVFNAQTLGGPFTITAEDGPITATAEVTVVDIGGPPPSNGTWTNASGGSWATNGNWAGGVIASGTGNTADFSTLNPTADTTVTLDAARAISTLIFGDTNTSSPATWFLTNGTNGSLQLAGSAPTITVNPLGSGKFANISARLSGFNGFTKTGSGNLILNNATNTLTGPVVLSGGNIQLNSASLTNASSVAINAGALIVATSAANAIGGNISFGGGNLQFNNAPGSDYSPQFSTAANQPYRISVGSTHEAAFNSNLASTGGTLTKLGTGTLILNAANSYSGGTTLTAGTLRFGNASALGSGPLAITGNTTLQAGLAATLANAVSIATGVTGTLDTNGHNTTLGGILTGSGNLTKTGSGTLNISGGALNNTLSGSISVNSGTLVNDNVNPSPGIQSFANMNGNITVASGATFNFSQSFTAENLDNNITLSGTGTAGLGALNLWRNATATGAITLAADATISHTFNTATISGPITGTDRNLTLATLNASQPGMTVSGPIQLGTGGITVTGVANSGSFSIRLTGHNSYSGETHVVSGTLMLSGDARIPDSSTVRIDSGAVLHLDFTGTDTVGALYLGGVSMPDGTYGSLLSQAANKSAAFSGEGILQVGTTNNYASWAANQVPPVTGGPNGDDDNDGVKNLIEYALADGGGRGVFSGNTLTFTKRGAPYGGDVAYEIETSTDLGITDDWEPAASGVTENDTLIAYEFTHGSPAKIFVRLKVVLAP